MKKIRLNPFLYIRLSGLVSILVITNWAVSQEINSIESNDIEAEQRGSHRSNLVELEQRLVKIESEYDAYDAVIAELSFDMANTLAELGRIDEAHSAYNRAIHVTRINNGLDAVEQIPILEAVLDLHTKTSELDASGEVINRLYGLHRDNYAENDHRHVNMLEKIGVWHLSAYFSRPDFRRIFHLVDASSALTKVQQLKSRENSEYDYDLYQLISMTNFMLIRQKLTESESLYRSYNNQTTQDSLRNSGQNATTIAIEAAFRKANRALEEGINHAQRGQNPENVIHAILLKADWNQLHNRRNTARKMYEDAYHIAIEFLPPNHEMFNSFKMPHKLPVFDDSLLTYSSLENSSDIYNVPLSFNVNNWGVTSNIKRLTDEGNSIPESAKRRAINELKSAKYRPAIIDGKAVNSENVNQLVKVIL